jgi:hypothetical protein
MTLISKAFALDSIFDRDNTPLMLMVIFGAGASYDSSPDFPPPSPQAGSEAE